jgi:phage tail sheath protein FI
MSEYLSPGVYVEELGCGPAPIEGVPTATAAFLGPTERGPTAPIEVTSFAEYRQLFGTAFTDSGYMFHAVAGFFENGGRRAVIARIVPARPGALVAADFDGVAVNGAPPTGLAALDMAEYGDVALIYAPDAHAIPDLIARLIAHCERRRDRFAVLDAPAGTFNPVAPADTRYAACYHPWIQVADRESGAKRLVPPGGHVLGVYARVDSERGVFKAPANEVVRGAVGLAADITSRQQEALNGAGVNVIRRLAGRGVRVWGARTLSSDPEWKYVSIARLFIYLERSIDQGTRWAVFEPNDERLWARVQDTVRQFLRVQWRSGALVGTTEEKAFFVRCDRTTLTQDDLDNGRMVCLVGVAPVRPAEFVILRIGQWTADRKP